jgi:hypothetical protein
LIVDVDLFHLCFIHGIRKFCPGQENSLCSPASLEVPGNREEKNIKMSFDELRYMMLSSDDSEDYDDLPGFGENAEEHEDLILGDEEDEGAPEAIIEEESITITDISPEEPQQPSAPTPAKPGRVSRISRPKATPKKKAGRGTRAAAPKRGAARKAKPKAKAKAKAKARVATRKAAPRKAAARKAAPRKPASKGRTSKASSRRGGSRKKYKK